MKAQHAARTPSQMPDLNVVCHPAPTLSTGRKPETHGEPAALSPLWLDLARAVAETSVRLAAAAKQPS